MTTQTDPTKPEDNLAIADRVHRASAQAEQNRIAAEEAEREEADGFEGLDEIDALDLLLSAEPAEQRQEVVLEPRKGTDKDLKLILRSVTEKEYDSIRNQAERTRPAGNRADRRRKRQMDEPELDQALMARLLIKAATVNVNWNDAALRDKFKVQSGEEVIGKVLLYGEVTNLAQIIMELSGFEEDLIQLVGEG